MALKALKPKVPPIDAPVLPASRAKAKGHLADTGMGVLAGAGGSLVVGNLLNADDLDPILATIVAVAFIAAGVLTSWIRAKYD